MAAHAVWAAAGRLGRSCSDIELTDIRCVAGSPVRGRGSARLQRQFVLPQETDRYREEFMERMRRVEKVDTFCSWI